MALILFVPILNFVVSGYLLQWAAEAARGVRRQMPKKIFADGAFGLGFYSIVAGLAFGAIYFVICLVLCFIPIVGWIAAMVSPIFVGMFVVLCMLRVGMSSRLGPAFDISSTWRAYKRKLGSLFGACFLPEILAGLVVAGASLVFFIVYAALMMGVLGLNPGALTNQYGMSSGLSRADASVIMVVVVVLCLAILIYCFVCMWIAVIAGAVTYRAAGIWVDRYAPEWKSDPRLASSSGANAATAGSGFAAEGGYPPAGASASSASHAAPAAPAAPAAAPAAVPGAAVGAAAAVGYSYAGSAPAAQFETANGTSPAPAAAVPEPESTGTLNSRASGANGGETEVLGSFDDEDYDTLVYTGPLSELAIVRQNGERLIVSSLPAVLGKGNAADIRITGNSSVSRSHARIGLSNQDYTIEDLNSTNKTYVNGVKLDPGRTYVLKNGAEVKLGNEVLRVCVS